MSRNQTYDPAYYTQLYARRRANGQCPRCCRPWPHQKPATCALCREALKVRNEAKRAGRDYQPPPRKRHPEESKRWAELETQTARCGCGLLAPCQDCGPTAGSLASSRRGGPTYPQGGGW